MTGIIQKYIKAVRNTEEVETMTIQVVLKISNETITVVSVKTIEILGKK